LLGSGGHDLLVLLPEVEVGSGELGGQQLEAAPCASQLHGGTGLRTAQSLRLVGRDLG
tara:strand:- start:27 stop:200 length:174 start_codon:yes stop_codon:yes gene_type:complete